MLSFHAEQEKICLERWQKTRKNSFYIFKNKSFQSNTIDSLINLISGAGTNSLSDSCCGINVSTYTLPAVNTPTIGDTTECGIIFWVSPDQGWAYEISYENFVGQWGCYNAALGINNYSSTDGQANSQLLLDVGCMTGTDAVTICDNYSYGGCDDWFLPARQEGLTILLAYLEINNGRTLAGFPVLPNTTAPNLGPNNCPMLTPLISSAPLPGAFNGTLYAEAASFTNTNCLPFYPAFQITNGYDIDLFRNTNQNYFPIRKRYF